MVGEGKEERAQAWGGRARPMAKPGLLPNEASNNLLLIKHLQIITIG